MPAHLHYKIDTLYDDFGLSAVLKKIESADQFILFGEKLNILEIT